MLRSLFEGAKRNKKFRKNLRESRHKRNESESSDSLELDFGENSNSENMPNTVGVENVGNLQLLKLFIEVIPNFSGEPCELNNFIGSCDEVISQFAGGSEIVEKLIFRAILGKLRGKALTLIASRSELQTWFEIKNLLKLSFSDQRSFTCLLQELHGLKQNPKENSYQFGIRCQYHRSLIFISINSDESLSVAEKTAQVSNIEKLILITFLKYLPPIIQTGVRLKQPKSLEEAMQFVLEEENFLSLVQDSKKSNQINIPYSSQKAPMSSTQTSQNFPRNQFHQMQQPLQQYSNFQNFPRNQFYQHRTQQPSRQQQQFPSQPIQLRNKVIPPQNFPTNQQVFGKPVNVWKPTGQRNPEKTTPMSVVTKQNYQPQKSFFQPQSRPTFYSEELNNTTTDDLNTVETNNLLNPPCEIPIENYLSDTIDDTFSEIDTEENSQTNDENFQTLASGNMIT